MCSWEGSWDCVEVDGKADRQVWRLTPPVASYVFAQVGTGADQLSYLPPCLPNYLPSHASTYPDR